MVLPQRSKHTAFTPPVESFRSLDAGTAGLCKLPNAIGKIRTKKRLIIQPCYDIMIIFGQSALYAGRTAESASRSAEHPLKSKFKERIP